MGEAIEWRASGYNLGVEGRLVMSSESRQLRAMLPQSVLEPPLEVSEIRIAALATGIAALAALAVALLSTARIGYIAAGIVAGIAQVYVVARFLEPSQVQAIQATVEPFAWLSIAAAAALIGLGVFYSPQAAEPRTVTRSRF
ncbi:MAG: hypothetical protein RML95_12330 [Anaerolineae bacterium]|nr:hypothetical protein [Anaerolineae bacterium]